jgi:L1 cell adhesion molecule like protein
MAKAEIHDIVLVGSSSRIPKVRQVLQNFFSGKELIKSVNPEEAGAYGAAIQAAILHRDKSPNIKDLLLLDATVHSLGISVEDGTMTFILKRNSNIPTIQRNTYTTAADNDTYLTIRVSR